ncbi:hypothetical protein INR49_019334 [Caranx melampygus]|nr:hypothetical protein INR49_019334 [Caranx melampygus]
MSLRAGRLDMWETQDVRFSPNMSSHTWVVSAGQTGLVRLNCLRSMFSPHVKDIIKKNQAQFNALYSPKPPQPQPQPEAEAEVEVEAEAVHTDANQL